MALYLATWPIYIFWNGTELSSMIVWKLGKYISWRVQKTKALNLFINWNVGSIPTVHVQTHNTKIVQLWPSVCILNMWRNINTSDSTNVKERGNHEKDHLSTPPRTVGPENSTCMDLKITGIWSSFFDKDSPLGLALEKILGFVPAQQIYEPSWNCIIRYNFG